MNKNTLLIAATALFLLVGCVSTMPHLDTAQWLHDNGECYAARKICILKLKENPGNEAATELLAKIHQKLDPKLAKPMRTTIGPPSMKGGFFPNWRSRDLSLIDDRWLLDHNFTTPAERALEKKLKDLDNIVIPDIKIEDGTLMELVEYLQKKAIRHDPDKRNINITFVGKEDKDLLINIDLQGLSLAYMLDLLSRSFELKIVRDKNTIKLIKEQP